ncbi:hypothetical protein DFH28DRAFT_1215932 [Melampsora americana]|nr:hypothetical protein DFH28DRAFT_1215932 [Melampsora americana]
MQERSQGLGTLISNFPEDHSDNSLKGLPIDELGLIQRQSSLWSANWRRISLFGQLEPVSDLQEAKTLYESFHPDSTLWNDNQNPSFTSCTSSWSKLRVEKVFYFGGFGDRSSIGSGEVKEVMEESLEGLEDDDEDFDLSEEEEEEDEELQELIELWEELDEPQITQVINNNYNNNYITHHHHHHHHHYRRPVSSSIESQVSTSSNQILEAIENAVTEIREELIEMADEMMEENQVGGEEEGEGEENEIFRSDQEEEEEEAKEEGGEAEEEEAGEEEEEENEVVNELLEKAFKTMELSEILEEMLDLTEVEEDHQLDSSSSKEEEEVERVQFEVEI